MSKFRNDIERALKIVRRHAFGPRYEDLTYAGAHFAGCLAHAFRVNRNDARTENAESFSFDYAAKSRRSRVAAIPVGRGKHHSDTVLALARQLNALVGHNAPHKAVGYLQQYPRAVAGLGLAAHAASVREIFENLYCVLDQFVGFDALNVHEHAYAAGIVFKGRIVQALPLRQTRKFRAFLLGKGYKALFWIVHDKSPDLLSSIFEHFKK
jgi:hypothetical protein